MTADTFAEFTGTEPDAYCSNTFTLYFTDKSGQKLVKEQRTVRYKRSIPKERIVLEQLMKDRWKKGITHNSGEYGGSECDHSRQDLLCGI